MKGRVHLIESMGSVDGPGLRYVIFLQGCNMKCLYCHNRDTWDCSGGEEIELSQILKNIDSMVGFYNRGDGGVTVSGGEPLLQPEFVSELFDRCHDMGLTTALDTSGHVVLTEKVKECLNKTDYLLMDVKSFRPEIHKKLVGVNRNLVEPFFDHVRASEVNLWLRYVLVPGYTDSKEDRELLAEFINRFNSIERVDILPYHTFGKEKWENMGYRYPLEGLVPPTAEETDSFRNYIKENTGVIVK